MIQPVLLVQPMEFGEFEAEELLNIGVGVFSLILLVLSVAAYRKTSLRRLIFVSTAFGLFAVQVLVRHLDMFVFAIGYGVEQVILTLVDFIILLLFFLALVVNK